VLAEPGFGEHAVGVEGVVGQFVGGAVLFFVRDVVKELGSDSMVTRRGRTATSLAYCPEPGDEAPWRWSLR
jgi:hypothetical protein